MKLADMIKKWDLMSQIEENTEKRRLMHEVVHDLRNVENLCLLQAQLNDLSSGRTAIDKDGNQVLVERRKNPQ